MAKTKKTIDHLWFCSALNRFNTSKQDYALNCLLVDNQIKVYQHNYEDNRSIYYLTDNNNLRMSLSGYYDENNEYYILICIVDPRYHGKGYASYLYNFIASQNKAIYSDVNLSPEAIRLWEKLKRTYPEDIKQENNRYVFKKKT